MKFFVTWLKEIGHFFAFDYSSQIPVLTLSFLSATESDFVKNKTNKTKTTTKKTIFDKQFIIFSQRNQLIFFLFGNTGKLVIET